MMISPNIYINQCQFCSAVITGRIEAEYEHVLRGDEFITDDPHKCPCCSKTDCLEPVEPDEEFFIQHVLNDNEGYAIATAIDLLNKDKFFNIKFKTARGIIFLKALSIYLYKKS